MVEMSQMFCEVGLVRIKKKMEKHAIKVSLLSPPLRLVKSYVTILFMV